MLFRHAAALAAVCLALTTASSRASVIININEVGSDVVVTGSGSINTAGLTPFTSGGDLGRLHPAIGLVIVGPTGIANVDVYTGVSGQPAFGSGSQHFPTSGSGTIFSIDGTDGSLEVPSG